jgi:ADP-dependent NAD(P)H-hydrate dehydratase / NAD(P)H-hydrate epimerase
MKLSPSLDQIIVTASQMAEIEGRIFAQGMPIPALMEKAALLMAHRVKELFPLTKVSAIAVLVGCGHNGGDALVIARELFFAGYQVKIYQPLAKLKDLTNQHAQYAHFLNINFVNNIEDLRDCELIIDGLFGFGLARSLEGKLAQVVNEVNQWHLPVVSVDLPSGIHTDTGAILGTAIKATHTLCLGLWKQGLFADQALEYVGQIERLDFGIPVSIIQEVLGDLPPVQRITQEIAQNNLPLPRPLLTHKYQQGHLLLICGSSRYAGAAILSGLGARASGVGMLSIAVPSSLKLLLNSHLPEALIIPCAETENGAIANLNHIKNLDQYDVIAVGMGLTLEPINIIPQLLNSNSPLILDADGLNILAKLDPLTTLKNRQAPTILTPHLGEFKRLFPQIINPDQNRIEAVKQASQETGAIVLLKGARTLIAEHNQIWVISESTPALARGGSGDILTGLIGGLLAQNLKIKPHLSLSETVALSAWVHSQGAILATKNYTELGVDGVTLAQSLNSVLLNISSRLNSIF